MSVTTLPTLTPSRIDPLVPPEIFLRLQATEGVSRVVMPSGDEAWLVTRYDLVREVLADPNFSADFFHLALLVQNADVESRIPGMFNRMDAPDHTRYRKALQRAFTARSIAALRGSIEQIVSSTVDNCAAAGPNVDFVETFALPIPSLVICELLGVPYADRARFHHWSQVMLDLTAPADAIAEAKEGMPAYIADLAAQYRRHGGTGLIAELVGAHGDEFTDIELGGLGFELLLAGHETTANMLSLSTLIGLVNPAARALFTDTSDEAALDLAVRELLRYLSITHMSPLRRALRDTQIADVQVRSGDYVVCHIPAANRDPRIWDNADELVLDRSAQPHLAFGFGAHLCLGQALARLEMQVALPAFFRRFPNVRLAADLNQLSFRSEMFVYGMHALPVTLG